jgi:hypothetical protein
VVPHINLQSLIRYHYHTNSFCKHDMLFSVFLKYNITSVLTVYCFDTCHHTKFKYSTLNDASVVSTSKVRIISTVQTGYLHEWAPVALYSCSFPVTVIRSKWYVIHKCVPSYDLGITHSRGQKLSSPEESVTIEKY